MKILIAFCLMILFRPACSENSDVVENNPIKTPVHEILSLEIENKTVRFTVVSSFPTPCYDFEKIDFNVADNTIDAAVFARLTTNDPCITMISQEEISSEITLELSGEYRLRFWKSDTQTLDTLIVVP